MTNPIVARESSFRYAKHALLEAIGLFIILKLATWHLLYRLPAGTSYVLESHGLGLLFDAAVSVVGMTSFLLLYTIPSFFARKWLGRILRALMFMLFVLFLTYLECTKYVAAVQTTTGFVFLSLFHTETIPNHQLPLLSIRDTGLVRSLEFDGQGVMFKPVWHGDTVANRTLDNLIAAINAARNQFSSRPST